MPQKLKFGVATADHQCEAYDGHDDIRDVWERVRGTRSARQSDRFLESLRGRRRARARPGLQRLPPVAFVGAARAASPARGATRPSRTTATCLQAIRDAGMSAIVTLVHNTWPLHVQAAGSGAGPLDPSFPDSVARYRNGGRAAARRSDRRLRHAQRTQPARLRLDQRLLDARLRDAAGAAAVRERRRANGRRPHAHPQSLSRACEGARSDSAHPAERARRHEPARLGSAAVAAALDRSQRDAPPVAGGCEASGGAHRADRRSSKAAASIARSRSSR